MSNRKTSRTRDERLPSELAAAASANRTETGHESAHDPLERRALHVDAQLKSANLARLRRIEGQVRGIQRMVEDERYCADILAQLAAAHEALRAVGRELLRNHLRHCASDAFTAGGERADAMCDELIDLMYKNAR